MFVKILSLICVDGRDVYYVILRVRRYSTPLQNRLLTENSQPVTRVEMFTELRQITRNIKYIHTNTVSVKYKNNTGMCLLNEKSECSSSLYKY